MVQIKKDSSFNPDADSILFNGDCLELLSDIPDNFVKLIVTSPPYNLDKVYENKLEMKDYIEGQSKVIKECFRILDNKGSICWQVGNYVNNGEITPLDIVLYPIFKDLGLHLRNRIIWHFGHGLHASKRFSGRYETIMWFTKEDDYTFNLDPVRVPQKYPGKKHFKGPNKGKLSCNPMGKNPSDIWEIPNVKSNHVEKTIHPCQFPVELIERLVLSMTNEGDWVFDPFMGVGSTAIASLINGRKSIGAEIMADYIKIAENRIILAENGDLKIRPMERNVFDPNQPNNIPPKTATINKKSNSSQTKLDKSIKDQ